MSFFTVESLSFSYPNQSLVFKDVSFSLNQGDILAIIGPNGVGKSTLLHHLAGLFSCQTGRITLENQSLASLSIKKRAQKIGYLPQRQDSLYEGSVLDYLVMGRNCYLSFWQKPSQKEYKRALSILDTLELSFLAHHFFHSLSGGEKQQIQFARLLLQHPKVIILDETMSALDLKRQHFILKKIQALSRDGYTIIFTTHDPNHALQLNCKVALSLPKVPTFQFISSNQLSSQRLSQLYNLPIEKIIHHGQALCFPLFSS